MAVVGGGGDERLLAQLREAPAILLSMDGRLSGTSRSQLSGAYWPLLFIIYYLLLNKCFGSLLRSIIQNPARRGKQAKVLISFTHKTHTANERAPNNSIQSTTKGRPCVCVCVCACAACVLLRVFCVCVGPVRVRARVRVYVCMSRQAAGTYYRASGPFIRG